MRTLTPHSLLALRRRVVARRGHANRPIGRCRPSLPRSTLPAMRTLLRRMLASQDPLLAAVLVVGVVAELLFLGVPGLADLDEPPGRLALIAAILAWLVVAAVTAWRRRSPLVVLGVAIVAAVLTLAGPLEGPAAATIAFGVVTYTAGAHLRDRDALVGGLGVAALVATAVVQPSAPIEEAGDLAAVLAMLGGPWLAGVAIRERRDREASYRARAEAAELDREARAATAVAAERTRIARELHDVVAHAIAVIVLKARGARRTIATDPAAATDALDTIESTGSEALGEMRRLVGLLRAGPDSSGLEPSPGLASLDTLVSLVREAGLPVDVMVEGTPRPLPAGIDLAAYRIVQEALTNALVHAGPAEARLVVRFAPSAIELEITDTGPGSGASVGDSRGHAGGHGVDGMRERVRLYGGVLTAGPSPDGGYGVRALLPLGQARL
jgi:signal transduction histidine kinase